MQRFVDGHGVPFAGYRALLPASVRDFPPMLCVKDPALLEQLHWEWDRCAACGRRATDWPRPKLELHHLMGGWKGRSDERTNLIMLCYECHQVRRLEPGRALYLKWKTDRVYLSWVRLAVLRRRFLPDLITD